jgi:hypothetical protein
MFVRTIMLMPDMCVRRIRCEKIRKCILSSKFSAHKNKNLILSQSHEMLEGGNIFMLLNFESEIKAEENF